MSNDTSRGAQSLGGAATQADLPAADPRGLPACTARQKKILAALLDKYEGSRTYRGENRVNQNFAVDPVRFFSNYRKDTTPVEQVETFESELIQLADAGLVRLEACGGEVDRVLMEVAAVGIYYQLLDRLPRAEQEQKEIAWYQEQMGEWEVLDRWCAAQITRLSQGKRATYSLEETQEIFRTLRRILSNQEELLERELSIDLFGDSKHFEKGVRRKACRVLRESGLYDDVLEGIDEPRLIEQVLLAEHLVVPNPTYLYMKGNGEIRMGAGAGAAVQGGARLGKAARPCRAARPMTDPPPA